VALAAGLTALIVASLWTAPRDPTVGPETPVGTAGHVAAAEPRNHRRRFTISKRWPARSTRTSCSDGMVDFHVKVSALRDATSFWIGKTDSRVLVVSMTPVNADQIVRITGTVEGQDQQVYIRASSVTPE